MMVLGFPDYDLPARRLAEILGVTYACIAIHRFPDGESKVTLPPSLPDRVVLCRSLNDPNGKLIELMLAAQTARQLGAQTLILVAPYLCYMRQDIAFSEGEAVSQTIVGKFLSELFDEVITLDPHLHRTPTLLQAIPAKRALALSATGLIGKFLSTHAVGAFILGPDEESLQWVKAVAADGFDYAVCHKFRRSDTQVQVKLPDLSLRGRNVVLVDDMASTGQTVVAATQQCLAAGAERVDAFVSHALFVQGAIIKMKKAGVSEVWSTDSITDASNVVQLAELLANAIGR